MKINLIRTAKAGCMTYVRLARGPHEAGNLVAIVADAAAVDGKARAERLMKAAGLAR